MLKSSKNSKKLLVYLLSVAMLFAVIISPGMFSFADNLSEGEIKALDANTVVYLNIGANGFNEGNTSFAGDKAMKLTAGSNYNTTDKRNYSPSLSNGAIQIVQDRDRQTGAAFLSRKIHSETGFSAMFNIWMGNSTGTNQPSTADGWAFVVSKSPNGVGGGGGNCGYGGLSGSFGIIYDVYYNSGADVNTNYPQIRFALNGSNTSSNKGFTVTQAELDGLLSNGMPNIGGGKGNMYNRRNYPLYCWVDYQQLNRTIEYYVSVTPTKPSTPTLTQVVDAGFIATLGEDYYLGFTGANAEIRQGVDLRQLYIANDYLPGVLQFNSDGSGLADSITSIEDYTAPDAPSLIQAGTESVSEVAFTLGGSSDINGLRGYQYSLDNGTTWVNYAKGSTPVFDGSLKITAPIDDSNADGDGDSAQLRVLARVIDNGGNISNITTQSLADAVIPHSALTHPPAGATNVFFADAQSLVIDFSNEMDVSTAGSVSISSSPGSSVALAGGNISADDTRWNAEHTRLTLPLSDVAWGSTYTVTVSGFKNTDGVTLNGGSNETFTYSVIAREAQPVATINYDTEKLTGLTAGASYKISGTSYTATGGNIPILPEWLGQNISIVKEGISATPTYDSAAQILPVPARPAAPTVSVSPGKITTTQPNLYYATTVDAKTGTNLSSGDNAVSDGTYYVRQQCSTDSSFRSEARKVEVAATIYTLTVTAPTFAAIAYGDAQPAAQSLDIANIGNVDSPITNVTSSSTAEFVIGGSGSPVPVGGSISTWTVRPAANLPVGVHTATVTVMYEGSRTTTTSVSVTVKEATPVPTIDYENERITGLAIGQLYSVNGDTPVNASSAGGLGGIAIKAEWLGTSVEIVKYNNVNSLLSDSATISVPSRPAGPAAMAEGETFAGFADGKITGVLATQEFSTDGGNSWRDVTASEVGSGITGLASGNAYRLRVKASNGAQTFHSSAQVLTVAVGTPPTYTADLTVTSTHDFGSKVYGYPAQTALSVGVSNTGNQPTGALTVDLSGTSSGSFTLSTDSVSSIAVSGNNASAFTVKPNDGLGVGTYTATVTLSGANDLAASFDVSFTVTPTQITGFVNPDSIVAGKAGILADNTADTNNTKYGSVSKVISSLLTDISTVTANYAGGTVSIPVSSWANTGTAYDISTPGEYTFTATLGSLPANIGNNSNLTPTVTVIINDITHGIQLGESGTYTIGTVEYGYTPSAHQVNITNIAVDPTGSLKATLSGPDSDKFTLSNGGIVNSIPVGADSTALSVTPSVGLAPRTYTATLTVSHNNDGNIELIAKSYTVSFTVTQAQITGFATIADLPAGAANAATYADAAAVIAALGTADVTANYAGGKIPVPITGWVDTDAYDPTTSGRYTFTAQLGVIPSNFLNDGSYTASIEVVVSADKNALTTLISDVDNFITIHEENYAASQVTALRGAIANANAVVSDASATQGQVDAIELALANVRGALVHDHPVIENSDDSGLRAFGQDLKVEIKGNIGDVVGLVISDVEYPITPKNSPATKYDITENGKVIGTITEGSAIVSLPAEFADRLTNGNHYIEVFFSDATATGSGRAVILVDRKAGSGALGSSATGDDMNLILWIAICGSALIMLLGALYVIRLRRKV